MSSRKFFFIRFKSFSDSSGEIKDVLLIFELRNYHVCAAATLRSGYKRLTRLAGHLALIISGK